MKNMAWKLTVDKVWEICISVRKTLWSVVSGEDC